MQINALAFVAYFPCVGKIIDAGQETQINELKTIWAMQNFMECELQGEVCKICS